MDQLNDNMLRSQGCFIWIAALLLSLFAEFGGTIPPQLNVATQDVRVRAGDAAVLTCVVDYLGAHQLTWHRGQNVVLAVDEKLIYTDRRMAIGRPSIRTWELRIQNVTRRDAGDYYCVINSRDLPSGKISLVVEESARIVSAPQPVVTVDEFETFKLICNATGFPRPRVEWFRLNDREELKISENYGEILLFINVTRDCFGRYRCRASNGVGEPEHRDTEVSVIARPVVVVDPENVGRERGGKVTVDCSISGHPISWAGWFLRGELLTNGGTPPSPPPLRRSAASSPNLGVMKQAASTRHRIEWLGRSSAYRAVLRLTIDPLLSDADFGSYTCAATDGRSFTSNASFYLWEKTVVAPGDGSVVDDVRVDPTQTTSSWRPSIIIDSRPPKTGGDGYDVASPASPSESSENPTTVIDQPQSPSKINDEFSGPPSSSVRDDLLPYETPQPPNKVLDERPAAADKQRRGSANGLHGSLALLGVSFCLVTSVCVFQTTWLTSSSPQSSSSSLLLRTPHPSNSSHLQSCSTLASSTTSLFKLQQLASTRKRRRRCQQIN